MGSLHEGRSRHRRGRPSPRPRAEEPILALLRRFWPATRGVRRWIALGAVLAAILPVVAAAEIWLFARLVDDVLVPGDLSALPALIGLFVGLNLLAAAIEFAKRIVGAWASEQFVLGLRASVFAHVLALSPLQVGRWPHGDLLTRLSGDVVALQRVLVSGPGRVVSAAVRIVVYVGMLFWLDAQLAVLALVATPLFWLLARRFAAAIRAAARERRSRSGVVATLADEVVGSLAAVQAARAERYEQARYDEQGRAAITAEMRATRLAAFFSPLVDLVELVGAMLVLAGGAWALAQGRLTLGELLAFLTYLSQLYGPVRTLTDLAGTAAKASASGERLAEVLDESPAVGDPLVRAVGPGPLGAGVVDVLDVAFRYPGAQRPALDGVSLTLRPGTVTALVGPSGSGKSTLAMLLLRLVDPESGAIRLDGRDLRSLPLAEVRAAVHLLLQDTYLFEGTIAENIRYGRPDATDSEVIDALRAADGLDIVHRRRLGMDCPIGPRGRALSGGQRRRLVLARALLRPAPVLVFDEFSTGLDPASTARVLAAIRDAGRTTLLVTHDPLVADAADRVLTISAGRIAVPSPRAAPAAVGGPG